ncbi:unnamed protein product [Caretta caretta]
MDRGSHFFYALEKKRGAKKHVTCLLAEDGTPLTDPEITDYKVVAKAILLWLGSVLADVVHPDQTYTVPGHTIFDNLYFVWDLLELGYWDGLSFALLSLDQEKVFNRVDHSPDKVYVYITGEWTNSNVKSKMFTVLGGIVNYSYSFNAPEKTRILGIFL